MATGSDGATATPAIPAPNTVVASGSATPRRSPPACRRSSSQAPGSAPAPMAPSSTPSPPGPVPSRSATTGASSWMGDANAAKPAIPMSSRRIAGSWRATARATRIGTPRPRVPCSRRWARISTPMSARNDTAFTAKHQVGPSVTNRPPPTAGPRKRATLMPAAFSDTAWDSRSAGTRAGTRARIAGRPSAKPTPSANVRT